ncbi:HPr family phosphocarrier protein [Romboutsia sp.]|uniref:HPr family phosphocarrier protein n=1 Tax=Romboutsia sp. TaxID=1965302 RepID=UPI003F3D4F72
MVSQEITIINETGVHDRLATGLIKKASSYKCEILISKGKSKMNAKSVLGICCLGIGKGDRIEIEANGVDEEKALEEIVQYILDFKK